MGTVAPESPMRGSIETQLAFVEAGPPRVA